MLDHALPSLDSWVLYFSEQELPVLRHTVRRLADARERMESVSGREIAHIILQDPMMTVRMLAYIQPLRGSRLRNDVTRRMLACKPVVEEVMRVIESTLHEDFMTNFSTLPFSGAELSS